MITFSPGARWFPRDRGVVAFVDGGPVFSGNGIPDAMEFKMLETVLKDATLDLGFEGGVMNGHVHQDWRHNLAQAQADCVGAPAEKRLLSPFPPQIFDHLLEEHPPHPGQISSSSIGRRPILYLLLVILLVILLLLVNTSCLQTKNRRPQSWYRTLGDLSVLLVFSVQRTGGLPYSDLGAEKALFHFVMEVSESEQQNFFNYRTMWELWGEDFIPFAINVEEERIERTRVLYWNKPYVYWTIAAPPRVLLVLKYENEAPEEVLFIGTDCNVYSMRPKEGADIDYSDFELLGEFIVELSKKYELRVHAQQATVHEEIVLVNPQENVRSPA